MAKDPAHRDLDRLLQRAEQMLRAGRVEKRFRAASKSTDELLRKLRRAQDVDPKALRKQVTI